MSTRERLDSMGYRACARRRFACQGHRGGAWSQCGEHNTYFDPFPTFGKHIEDYLREQAEIEAKNNEILADFGYKVDRHGALAYLDGTVVSDSEDEEPTGSDAKSAALG